MIVFLDTVMAHRVVHSWHLKGILLPKGGYVGFTAVLELDRPGFDSWLLLVLVG